ncbi:MAG: hypothetical protein WA715_16480 [Candidatus Acidiferrum sp.]
MEKQNSLATISRPPISEPPDTPSSSDAIRQFLVKAGEIYRQSITSALVSIWIEELGSYPAEQLAGLFRHTLRTWKPEYGRTFPVPADVLTPLEDSPEAQTSAGLKWTQVLDFVRRYYWADVPGCIASGAPRISERTMTAIRAAGGIAWIADCDREQLVWCKKAFIESYMAWAELERDEYLLPADSPIRELLSGAAEKLLPAPLSEPMKYTPAIVGAGLPEGHPMREILADAVSREGPDEPPVVSADAARIAELEQRLSVAERLAAAARAVIELGVSEASQASDARLVAINAQAETLQTQAEMIKQRFPMTIPDDLPADARRYIR